MMCQDRSSRHAGRPPDLRDRARAPAGAEHDPQSRGRAAVRTRCPSAARRGRPVPARRSRHRCVLAQPGSARGGRRRDADRAAGERRGGEGVRTFSDPASFADARRGFIAAPTGQVKDAEGNVIWDFDAYAFVKGEAPATVNLSLWRQALLNNQIGLSN
ncbi:MAG: hypothetical protein MZW92_26100 [Comamonadaceae bacterium]|nr:hypothetical protein [Comamonadaceae bacterium]